MQCKKILEEKDAEAKVQLDGGEDGPPSSESAEDLRDITDDDSVSSSAGQETKPHGAIYGGYFERVLGSWAGPCLVASGRVLARLRVGRDTP